MSNLPSDLPQRLRKYGLNVVEIDGWQTRGRPASTGTFAPVGVLCHHTASSSNGMAAIPLLVQGRSDLPGPLCQLSLDRQGVVYVVAAGRANHAGVAKPCGTVAGGDGNTLYIGVEAQNEGTGEAWPKAQYDAYVLLAAVLCVEITGNSYRTVNGHKETSVTGKIDPAGPTPYESTFDMGKFRARVAVKITDLKRKPKPAPTLTVIGWNCYVANSDQNVIDTLTRWTRKHRPDIACLSEARTHADALDIPGYTPFQRPPATDKGGVVNDQGDSAILVRNDLVPHVTHHRVAKMRLKWVVFGHNQTHTPRQYEVLTLKHGGRKWRIRASHWPTHGFEGGNHIAFAESATRSKTWLRLGVRSTSIDVGDLNDKVGTVALHFGKGFKVVGSGIDMLIGHRVKSVEHTELDKGGSDHHGQLYVVTAR